MSKLNILLDFIYKKSPLHKKKLEKYLSTKDKIFWNEAEKFVENYLNYLNKNNISLEYIVDAYLKMCDDMLKSQVSFLKTGIYPVLSQSQAFKDVYDNEIEMKSYMIGLAISQYLWSTHYDMFTTFIEYLKSKSNNINNYLEIGPGHGLFLSKAIEILSNNSKITAVDISPMSIKIAKSIIKHTHPSSNVNFINADIMKMSINEKYDFVTMGEVLEHVLYPEELLHKISQILGGNGTAFISTCVDCPAIDHVYHFKSVEEIRSMISECGLKIKLERVLPVENLPMEEIVSKKVTIIYCAILQKNEKI